ncbi:MAG: GAF domain-containing protein [Herpetosiphonaceae bacterium]|nr:GAF domain-containing protein [Herpetosiphonaceae bacterium]
MTNSQQEKAHSRKKPAASGHHDAVHHSLEQAIVQNEEARRQSEQQVQELSELRVQLHSAQLRLERYQVEATAATQEIEQLRGQVEGQRTRAHDMAIALKDIHRSLWSGNIYELILRTCLALSGATRGLYITARSEEDILEIRAVIDVDHYPQKALSPFISGLCRQVLEQNDVIIHTKNDTPAGELDSNDPGEQFRNYVVAPVVLLKNLDGILIAIDKVQGDFEKADVELLLSVGDQAAVAVEKMLLANLH